MKTYIALLRGINVGGHKNVPMAGVDIIVMSLWKVPDLETAEFMTLFYEEWINIVNIKEAFNNAQKKMRHKHMDKPKNWAAFVLFE